MSELLMEIWASMRKNKLRTFLTGFSVAWGIFILVVLLGAGNGVKHGISSNFSDMAVNSMTLYSNVTSKAYAGYDRGRYISLKNRDLEIIRNEFDVVDDIEAYDTYNSQTFTYKEESNSSSLIGATPNMMRLDGIDMLEGRFINKNDIDGLRKVIVIDDNMRKVLFNDRSPLGKAINCAAGQYLVIGVFKGNQLSNSAQSYIPLSTAQLIFNQGNPSVGCSLITIDGINTVDEYDALADRLRRRLAAEHTYAPDDQSAVWISNNFKEFQSISKVFKGFNIFLWVVGLGTLMAGIVGVGNIMLVTVRERTYEFGLRKAIGAKPRSIIFLILLESIIVTSVFGYMGMVLGVGTMEIVNKMVERAALTAQESSFDISFFSDPTLDLSIIFSATAVLVISGIVAGYIPARRASKLKTVDALRFNK